jgi:molybdate transport system ATP-binding protein
MMLDARIRLRRSALDVDVTLQAERHHVVALLGPNGAGKTTVLRALAGLVAHNGQASLDGQRLDAMDEEIRVPTHRRPVSMVFQDYLLFPHLSALDNVAFGLRSRGRSRRDARTHAAQWLARVGLADFAAARVATLSGGQAQRVALARALIVEPALLLLDEPLAALDSRTKVTVRSELRRHLDDFPGCTIVVTHDSLDAMVLGDRIVVMEHGHVVQEGAPVDVARHPRTDYVARLVGLNLHRGTATDAAVTLESGLTVYAAPDATKVGSGQRALVAFPPAAVALHLDRPRGSPRNVWSATVAGVEKHAGGVRVELDGPVPCVADVTPAAMVELGLVPGQSIWAAVKATEVVAYPA